MAARNDPFTIAAGAGAYVPRPASEAALARLEEELARGRRLLALHGPTGLGKTFLLRVLLERLEDAMTGVLVPYGALATADLCALALGLLAESEGLEGQADPDPRAALLAEARRLAEGGRPLLLCIDDASSLALDVARDLAALAEEAGGSLRILVVPIDDGRGGKVLAALGAELAEVRYVEPLDADESAALIAGRLDAAEAAADVRERFGADTVARIHRAGQGSPRRMLVLAGHVWREGEDGALAIELAGHDPMEIELGAGSDVLPGEEQVLEGAQPIGFESGAEVASETESEPEGVVAAPLEAGPLAQPAAVSEPEPELEPEPAPPLPEPEPAVVAEPEPEPEVEVEPEPEPVVEAEPERPAEAVLEAEPQPAPEPAVEAEPEVLAEPPVEAEPAPEVPSTPAVDAPVEPADGRTGPGWGTAVVAVGIVALLAVVWMRGSLSPADEAVTPPPAASSVRPEPSAPEPVAPPETEARREPVVEPAPPPEPTVEPALPPEPAARPAPVAEPLATPDPEPAPPEPTVAPAPTLPETVVTPEPAPAEPVVAPAPPPPPAPKVAVNINAVPWAQVAVDGEDLGYTPLAGVSLTEGSHRFVVTFPDGRVLDREIAVGPDSRHFSFSPPDTP